jgi:hypothetical protein
VSFGQIVARAQYPESDRACFVRLALVTHWPDSHPGG